MTLEDGNTLAASAAKLWKERFAPHDEWPNESSERIYNKLIALGDSPKPEEVDEVLGNDSWTKPLCDICNDWVDEVVRCSSALSSDVDVCRNCAKKIYMMFLSPDVVGLAGILPPVTRPDFVVDYDE